MLSPFLDPRSDRAAAATASVRVGAMAEDASLGRRVLRNLAVLDAVPLLYFTLLASALLATRNANCWGSLKDTSINWLIVMLTVVLVRGELVRGVAASFLYRVGMLVPVVLSYFQLRWILPAITSRSLDHQIYDFDLRVFHYEPSVAWDKYVSYGTTEWFAFFYFGYFLLLAVNVLPFLAMAKDGKLLRHFITGLTAQFCITHLTYALVPGFGPYHELQYAHPLAGGVFWSLVLHSVHSAGALKDIFPSLHTGAPTYIAIFAFVHRDKAPFKYVWPVLAFCASQIIIATMFLRWHYLVDIVAGLSLAAFNVLFFAKVEGWEAARRERLGLTSVFGSAPLPWLIARLRRR